LYLDKDLSFGFVLESDIERGTAKYKFYILVFELSLNG